MWPWIKHWRDWAMHNLWPLYRLSPQPQALHFGYEKAGITVHDQPVPWNAEAVLVEAALQLRNPSSRRKGDYALRLPSDARRDPAPPLIPAEQLRRGDSDDRHTLHFRFPPPQQTTTAELLFRGQSLGQVTLPFLSREVFLTSLRLQMPTLYVRLGEASVACQTFVTTQCKGMLASAVLTSPTSLVPLLDLDLAVELRCEKRDTTFRVPANLCSTQLAGRQALVTVVLRRHPRRIGSSVVTWMLGEHPLASQRIRGISQRTFLKSLRISDTRFVVQKDNSVRLCRQIPPDGAGRIGPCFLVSSCEPGMAGLCTLQVMAQVPGSVRSPLILEQEVLITDGPTPVAPGTLDGTDLEQVSAFDLSVKGRSLGILSLCPAPTASFTAEGGFKQPGDYTWSLAAEEEMTERLNRLMDGGNRRN